MQAALHEDHAVSHPHAQTGSPQTVSVELKQSMLSTKIELLSSINEESRFLKYTQQKKKVDTFSTLVVPCTNSIDGKCHISYEIKINCLYE